MKMVTILFNFPLSFFINSFINIFTNFLMGITEIFSDKPCTLLSFGLPNTLFTTLGETLITLFVLPTLVFFVIAFSYRLYRLILCKNTIHAYVIKSSVFPKGNVSGIALYPTIVVNKISYEARSIEIRKILINHELIHIHQQHETFVIVGYLVYGLEYLIRLMVLRDRSLAYRTLSMEHEAYLNQNNLQYLANRRSFAWIKYLFTKNY